MSGKYTAVEVAKHNKPNDAWIIVNGKVYDVTNFTEEHPGGKKILLNVAGKDASAQFAQFHNPSVLLKYNNLLIGEVVAEVTTTKQTRAAPASNFGDMVPYGDASWYQGLNSPFYGESHKRLRAAMREWVEKEVTPYVYEWEEKKTLPAAARVKAAESGWFPAIVGSGKWPTEYVGDKIMGGVKPEEFDAFHELIIYDELCRCASGGVVWCFTVCAIGLPPIMNHGTKQMKEKVIKPCLEGKKVICLCITEPYGGSDVANLKTEAKKTADGKHYIVNGEKKWITNGIYADFFTVAVRTGGSGHGGISLLLLERGMPGITTKQMNCQGVWSSGTSYVTFEDVKVPVENLIGKEGEGFKYIMNNFNHERWGVIAQSIRFARTCYEEAFVYAHKRKTFGQRLIDNGVIRSKLGGMSRQVESVWNWLENITYQMKTMSHDEANIKLGGPIALLKVQATLVLEWCAREAIQIYGGLGYTRGGQAEKVERIYRDVRAMAIGGGSEEILNDLGIRQAMKLYQSKL